MAPPLEASQQLMYLQDRDPVSNFLRDIWHWIGHAFLSVRDWIIETARGVNSETLEHPYLMSFALFVICAWPHILVLPVWFARDGARRMETHTRNFTTQVAAAPRRRRRDYFISRYRSIVNVGYEPPPPSNPALFGGTPLTEGRFNIEDERSLSWNMRLLRWSALLWAIFILGREWYHFLQTHT